MGANDRSVDLVDGYDRDRLARCLAARGLFVDRDAFAGVDAAGTRIDFHDAHSLWTLPRWIGEAKTDA